MRQKISFNFKMLYLAIGGTATFTIDGGTTFPAQSSRPFKVAGKILSESTFDSCSGANPGFPV